MIRHHNTAQSAQDIIRTAMKNRPVVLQIKRELVDEHKDIVDTAAGETVNQELNEQIRRHQIELKEVQEQMMQTLKEKGWLPTMKRKRGWRQRYAGGGEEREVAS